MNGLKVNYIQIGKVLHCLAAVKESGCIYLKCCPSACLENQKVQRKGRITWKKTNKTDNNRWDISSLREVMFHHKLDSISVVNHSSLDYFH